MLYINENKNTSKKNFVIHANRKSTNVDISIWFEWSQIIFRGYAYQEINLLVHASS